ncbi:hypothetical protein O6H91_03G054300 [Diphasiastrum complanatum]|uniref:Uncharacterized protein n=5 Tax=Diphasiastrum complanatum TaxID=34168 RepID=A0ACC2E6H9_DIPCM|nr:hypothetical protein O6H91_03G054300 [Diphasiastrum complanatum]KAJ7562074.1 hypothetical protein O6H91_03G054300 [Diphasiastrum complanatum]KAJ7562075.1 hypothetical protein O6H91_03G054300 [Diphasiastrum complanatum]KAJ7562076.1 hypothetical protein O6H91_03G054300 [Diphasiastrum complanatum]KAJ7562077.1 hypothetical protein O6H91_03G054300 [Diphasiastrum complanatum]
MTNAQASQSNELPRKRPARACTARTPSRLAPPAPTIQRLTGPRKQSKVVAEVASPIVLVSAPVPGEEKRWQLRSMWQLASVFNFLKTFKSLLSLDSELSFNQLESSLLVPNRVLEDVHIALLKGVPPVSRTPLGRETWVTVLCKKLKDRWSWVGEGPCPIVASHGDEMVIYKELDPPTRVEILKALCEIRLDQDDFRSHVDEALKHGHPISVFRKERLISDTHGTTYWYEEDSISGHRLYRELQQRVETKTRGKSWGCAATPPPAGQWETLATCIEEFQTVAEKLASSKNRHEAGLGNRIQTDIMPELEELQKKKERAIKRQQRQVLLLNNAFYGDGLAAGRSRRDRKPVTYTFDEYDRSINEAIKFTKKHQPSPEPIARHGQHNHILRNESAAPVECHDSLEANDRVDADNGHVGVSEKPPSQIADQSDRSDEDSPHTLGDRNERLRRRPQRYSEHAYVDDDELLYSDDDIEGEAVYYDDVYAQRKRRRGSGSDTDEEYRGEEDGDMEEDEDEEEDADVESEHSDEDDISLEDGFRGRHFNRYRRNEAFNGRKLRSVGELQSGLRRSERSTRSAIDYSKYEGSDYEEDPIDDNHRKRNGRFTKVSATRSSNSSLDLQEDAGSESSDASEARTGGEVRDSEDEELACEELEIHVKKAVFRPTENGESEPGNEQSSVSLKHRFLDLNQAAPMGPG